MSEDGKSNHNELSRHGTTLRPTTNSEVIQNRFPSASTHNLPINLPANAPFPAVARKSSLNFSTKTKGHPEKHRRASRDRTKEARSPERRAEGSKSRTRPPVSLRSSASPDKERRHSSSQSTTLAGVPESREESQPAIHAEVDSRKQAKRTSISSRDSISSTRPFSKMLANYGPSQAALSHSNPNMNGAGAVLATGLAGPMSPTMEILTYQHMSETASKRISTLDYLRKAHEGRVYWFNTLLFTKSDISRLPYFDVKKLSRRATNYLLLGISLPTIIDLYANSAVEFLRTFNSLMTEFEAFQAAHPPDGTPSSLSRARLPQMFKRSMNSTQSKGRRTSSAAEAIGLPYNSVNDNDSNNPMSAFPASESDLLPGEEYSFLMTPSLPFDPDFFETFATLCDVLIDCYTKCMQLVAGPKDCNPGVAEAFSIVDKRVRKLLISGIVKEFEEACRSGAKAEVAGVGKVVLGGLM